MTLYHGDCIEVMRGLADNSVDAVVTDPPYGLSFMGKKWDYDVPDVAVWAEALRVLKPGGHLLAFAGTRTQHRMACRIEDAGFEIRDMLAWVYGSGFPKSLDVSKAIDKAAGVEFAARPASGVGFMNADGAGGYNVTKNQLHRIGDTTHAARKWDGWGTALKPALEPITLARKPLVGTVAANVLEYGTGGLNIDACRVGTFAKGEFEKLRARAETPRQDFTGGRLHSGAEYTPKVIQSGMSPAGRWPANLIHDGSDEVLAGFPDSKSTGGGGSREAGADTRNGIYGKYGPRDLPNNVGLGDSVSAARFFYCAKASRREREAGLDGMAEIHRSNGNKWTDQDYRVTRGDRPPSAESGPCRNTHPTVKPIALMRYLCRLVTPPGGIVLDPFMGSGTTGIAAQAEGFQFVGIERDAEYYALAEARIKHTPHQLEIAT